MGQVNQPPLIHPIRDISLSLPLRVTLPGGIPMYVVSMGTQEVIKLEFVFKAGRPYEKKQLSGRATTRLLREGTSTLSGREIAEKIDYYGATLTATYSIDTGCLTLFCLPRHLPNLLPVMASILAEPVFPERELQTFKENNIERLKIELSKPDVLAYRTITELVFGKSHPYGYNSIPETYEALTREDVVDHFNANYRSQNCTVFLSGIIKDEQIQLIQQYLGHVIPDGKTKPVLPLISAPEKRKVRLDKCGYNQTSIRIGRRMIPRAHPDFNGLYLLNTVLGGYFGSKLMTKIREEKGYTYNIYSSLDSFLYEGFFYLSTEVSNEFVTDALKEIRSEITLLRESLIPAEELNMAKNYLMGYLLTLLDGPFNTVQIVRSLVLQELPFSTFDDMVREIKSIQPEILQSLAQQYFKEEDLIEVLAS